MYLIRLNEMKIFCGETETCDVTLMCDYIGNIYIKNNNTYFYAYISDTNIELILLKSIDVFKKNLVEYVNFLPQRFGKIIPSDETLRGKTMKCLFDLPEDEKYGLNFSSCDTSFEERAYYTSMHNSYNNDENEDDNNNDDDESDDETFPFYISGIDDTSDIEMADIMMTSPASHDTIIMRGDLRSTAVSSTIERKDGYCSKRVTIYTAGYLKINNVADTIKYFKLVLVDGEISVVPIVRDE